MKKKIKKFWQWLCQTRYITIGFGNESLSEDEKLAKEFQRAKEDIQIVNFQKIMLRLVDFERTQELAFSGLLLTDTVAIERALAKFQQAKREGRIDELNNIVQQEETTNEQR